MLPEFNPAPGPPQAGGLGGLLAWPRLRFVLLAGAPFGLLLSLGSVYPAWVWVGRAWLIGLAAVLAFGAFERWPRRLPPWVARWVLQLVGVVALVPPAAWLASGWVTDIVPRTDGAELARLRWGGFSALAITGALFAPWMALAALLRQRDAQARRQALQFALERSELERQALDARLRLMQAQVQPHFLFNTLANVRALVNAGSPRAGAVLDSLIAYLRAAVPRLDDPAQTVAQELQLVRAYLELMHLRMPDRLQYTLQVDPAAESIRCLPLSLLTLVENAVRHGIDPSEEGGRIDVSVQLQGAACRLRVSDTGVGLRAVGQGLGTGLSTLSERLKLAYGGAAHLLLSGRLPRGVCAEIQFPASAGPAAGSSSGRL